MNNNYYYKMMRSGNHYTEHAWRGAGGARTCALHAHVRNTDFFYLGLWLDLPSTENDHYIIANIYT